MSKTETEKKLDALQAEIVALKETAKSQLDVNEKLQAENASLQREIYDRDSKALSLSENSIEVTTEVAGAILTAASSQTGYVNTTSSEHATRVNPGIVKVELYNPAQDKRQHVTVSVPDFYSFQLYKEDVEDAV